MHFDLICKFNNLYFCSTPAYALYDSDKGSTNIGINMDRINGTYSEADDEKRIDTNLTLKSIIRCHKDDIYVGLKPASLIIKLCDDIEFIINAYEDRTSRNRSSYATYIEKLDCTLEDLKELHKYIMESNPGIIEKDYNNKNTLHKVLDMNSDVGAGIGNNDKHALVSVKSVISNVKSKSGAKIASPRTPISHRVTGDYDDSSRNPIRSHPRGGIHIRNKDML